MAEEKRIARLLMGLGPGDGVLDVACGPGNFTRDFARAVGDDGLAVGVDGSRPMLERAVREAAARAEIDNLAFVHCDATALPFRDASFDAVCCFAALNLFAEPFAALDEMRRVLSRGGRIALFTSARRHRRPACGSRRRHSLGAGRDPHVRPRRDRARAARARVRRTCASASAGLTQFVGGRLGP